MADRAKPTLEYLRELARKKLGPGHSKLRREELLQALEEAKVSTRRAPVVQSAMKKTPAGEGGKKSAPATEPAKASRSKKVAIEDVAEEHEKKRSATLKKKVGADSLEVEAKKGARPVTARLSETQPALSKGVARVKSAIANIAKEVEARRVAREAEAAPKAAAKANIQKEQVASRAVVSKEIEPAAKSEGLPTVKSAAPRRTAKAAASKSEVKFSETPKPAAGAKAKPEAAKPAAAAKVKAETVEAAKPTAAAAKVKAETVEAAKPTAAAAKAKAETVEAAKPTAAAAKAKAETVEAAKPTAAAAKAKAETVEAAKPAAAAKAKVETVAAAKPAAAAKAKVETVAAAKPAAATRAKVESVEAATPAAAKAHPESAETAKPAAAANVEAVQVPKPVMAERAKTGNVEAPKPAAAAKPEFVPQPAAPAAREARPGAGAVITEAPWLQTAAKLQAERAETVKVATQNVESKEVPRAALELKEVRSEPSASVASIQAPTVESRSTPASPPEPRPVVKATAKVPTPAGPPEPSTTAKVPPPPEPVLAASPPRPPSPQPGTLLARATLEETPAVVARQLLPSRNVPPATTGTAAPPAPRRRRRTGAPGADTVVEGFFVARIAGRQEAERHALTDSHPGSPSAYSQGMSAPTFRRIVLLPRDPRTLFVFFDLATSGIELREGERVVVRIFDDGQAIRQLAAEQISRGFYVDGLQSLRSYYAEAWALGPQGERFLGPSSNTVSLPGVGAPAERVRFLKVPWTLPLPRLRDLARSGQVRVAERDGDVRVGMRHAVWHQEGPHAWDPSMSGQGRWVVVSEEEADQYELIEREVEYPAGDSLRDGLPTTSGAGRPSSFTLVRPK